VTKPLNFVNGISMSFHQIKLMYALIFQDSMQTTRLLISARSSPKISAVIIKTVISISTKSPALYLAYVLISHRQMGTLIKLRLARDYHLQLVIRTFTVLWLTLAFLPQNLASAPISMHIEEIKLQFSSALVSKMTHRVLRTLNAS